MSNLLIDRNPLQSSEQDARPNRVLRTGVKLYSAQEAALDKLLDELTERCPASFVLLADSSGQLISYRGEHNKNNLVALSSLIAGDIAASQEIARLTGEYQACQLVLREGPKYNTFIAEAGENLVLFVQAGRDTPLGWARMLIQFTTRQAATILKTAPAETMNLKLEMTKENLADLVGDALSDALDDLWMG